MEARGEILFIFFYFQDSNQDGMETKDTCSNYVYFMSEHCLNVMHLFYTINLHSFVFLYLPNALSLE